jgi:hypothetical protein
LLSEIPKLFDMKSKIKAQDVVDAVKRYHGYDISMRQAQRALTKLQPRHAEGQGEEGLDLEMSAGEQQSPEQSPESQGDAGPAYEELSESRWLPGHIQSSLIDDDNMPQDETTSSHIPPPPSNPQALPAQAQHPPMPPQNQTPLTHSSHPMTMPPGAEYQNTGPLPVAVAAPPKPPNYPRSDHTAVPQMVLTNFKIEFTCTTCGSLNQSYFPNQGNVTGASYIGHAIPNPSNVPRNTGPQNGVDSNNAVGENPAYDINASNTPAIQNAWAVGGLGVPIGSSHT